jgi:hypothetical protein
MASEKAIMASRREFLSNTLGIGLVAASTWPIPSVDTSKPATRGRVKTGHFGTSRQVEVYRVGCS